MKVRASTALSKAAAEHRRNHQIPRKRPLNYPPLYRQPPKVKKAPPRIQKQKPEPAPPAPHQQLRGENRKRSPRNNGDSWPVRRILAARRKSTDESVIEYKVQWDTSWEEASAIEGHAIGEWEEAIASDDTFSYPTRDGAIWRVLKDETKEENDHEEMQWDMWVAIHRNVLDAIDKDWLQGLADEAFEFADGQGNENRDYLMDSISGKRSLSALGALRAADIHFRDNPNHGILYGDIKIRYIGRLDPRQEEANDGGIRRPSVPIATIIRTLHSHGLSSLDVNAFTNAPNVYAIYTHWREVLCELIKNAPFVLRSGTWIQLFALLLISGDTFRSELQKVGIMVGEDWPSRAREYAMHMYYEIIVDDRATHDIQETFLCLREFFRELQPDDTLNDTPDNNSHEPSDDVAQEHRATSQSRVGSVIGTDGRWLPPLREASPDSPSRVPVTHPSNTKQDSPVGSALCLHTAHYSHAPPTSQEATLSSSVSSYSNVRPPPRHSPPAEQHCNTYSRQFRDRLDSFQREKDELLGRLVEIIHREKTQQGNSRDRSERALEHEPRRNSGNVGGRRTSNYQVLLSIGEYTGNAPQDVVRQGDEARSRF